MEKEKLPELKGKAKEAIKSEQFTEAFLYLSHALNLEPENTEMLSDRCRCLLSSEQYNLALQDAQKIVELSPNSSCGHARHAEIYTATFNFDLALKSYQQAFQCADSNKEACMEGINRCKKEIARDKYNDRQFPYVGCALGIMFSSLILVLDYLSFREESYVAHPLLKAAVCIAVATAFYWSAKLYRSSVKRMRTQLLEPPPDLLGLFKDHDD